MFVQLIKVLCLFNYIGENFVILMLFVVMGCMLLNSLYVIKFVLVVLVCFVNFILVNQFVNILFCFYF